jgi:hypothetical protein
LRGDWKGRGEREGDGGEKKERMRGIKGEREGEIVIVEKGEREKSK